MQTNNKNTKIKNNINNNLNIYRQYIIIGVIILCITGVIIKLVNLSYTKNKFLVHQAEHQFTRTKNSEGSRGEVLDRNGLPLAISVPISDLILDPKVILNSKNSDKYISELSNIKDLNISKIYLIDKLNKNKKSRYLILKKEILPETSKQIKALKLKGVFLKKYERTFYPGGNSSAQLIGFTDNNNNGQFALEKTLDPLLSPKNGKKSLMTTAKGGVLSIIKVDKLSQNGKDINLSIDQRIQYLVYNTLKKQVTKIKADSGSAVVLDPFTGEVLAAVSYPSFNPNNKSDRVGVGVKNRAITDRFEPGSTMKPFIIAAALQNNAITTDTIINTSPGYYYLNKHRIKDDGNYGELTPSKVIQKSSNIGASKIALMMPKATLYQFLSSIGFGQPPGGNFPASTTGYLPDLTKLGDFSYATISFGYGLSSSCLQLARATSIFANGGKIYPTSFLKLNKKPIGMPIVSPEISLEVRNMLHTVTNKGGTGLLANIPGYDVAGKTGTAHQLKNGKYKNTYNAIFAGMAPLKNPKIVVVVRIDHPKRSYYDTFGGIAAAPVFAEIAKNTLRMLDVPMNKKQIDKKFFKNQENYYKLIAEA